MHFKRNCYEELRTSCATDLRAVIRRHVAIVGPTKKAPIAAHTNLDGVLAWIFGYQGTAAVNPPSPLRRPGRAKERGASETSRRGRSQYRAFGQNNCVRRVSVDRATVSP